MTYAQQKLIEDLIDWQKNDIVLGCLEESEVRRNLENNGFEVRHMYQAGPFIYFRTRLDGGDWYKYKVFNFLAK